ncbi:MAG: folate-binding protein [Actinomycetota bacterium]|nr:folate-binding protein [Actinomycetota bacterium]MDQ2959204.1 folate-binding protein [Actinomycetota bacterium]
MADYRSPLLDWPGAVPADGLDAGIAWHYGDPIGEQRRASEGAGLIDLTTRDILVVPGPDRLAWLHAICSQHLSGLVDGDSTQALVLSPNGHVEQHWQLTELGEQIWLDTEPGMADEALGYLLKMRFLKRVEPTVVTADYALLAVTGPDAGEVLGRLDLPVPSGTAIALPDGGFLRHTQDRYELLVPRATVVELATRLRDAGAEPIGSWAAAALRVEQRRPRLGIDTDHRTLAHEAGWIGTAVHLDKGCYRGQETVARVQNLGKPPRRLVLLHLSGDSERLPAAGSPVERDGRAVGFVGTAVQHYEYGPIALAIVKRNLSGTDVLVVGEHSAALDPADAIAELPTGFAGHAGPAQTSA